MLLLCLTYLLVFVGPLHGIPLLPVPGHASTASSAKFLGCEASCASPQALKEIYTCLLIILAGTFMASHPSIPSPRETPWASLKRQTSNFVLALLAPELTVARALKEYIRAGRIAQKYNDEILQASPPEWTIVGTIKQLFTTLPRSAYQHVPTPWTRTHGFFLQMGGFLLYEDGIASRTLDYDSLRALIKDKAIDIPIIKELDIHDRSKGEFVSRAFVALVTLSFFTKCARNVANGLSLSDLEIVTLAHVSVDAVAYALWWNKPQNVGRALPVDLKMQNTYADEKSILDEKHALNAL